MLRGDPESCPTDPLRRTSSIAARKAARLRGSIFFRTSPGFLHNNRPQLTPLSLIGVRVDVQQLIEVKRASGVHQGISL
jgi:hypothetical protein